MQKSGVLSGIRCCAKLFRKQNINLQRFSAIEKNFSYIHKAIDKKRKGGILASILTGINKGKLSADFGIYKAGERKLTYLYYKKGADNKVVINQRPKSQIVDTKKVIERERTNDYYSDINKGLDSNNKYKYTKFQKKLKSMFTPKNIMVNMRRKIVKMIHPLYKKIYKKRRF